MRLPHRMCTTCRRGPWAARQMTKRLPPTNVELLVSRLSVLACRVKPLGEGDAVLLKRYDDIFASVHIVELSVEVVDAATQLRAGHGLKTSDA